MMRIPLAWSVASRSMIPGFLCLVFLMGCAAELRAQDKPAYILYNARGKRVRYHKMISRLQQQDVVLFGEYHNNPIAHWLELSVTRDLGGLRGLVLGAEMFERDNQEPLNQYLAGTLSAGGLDSSARLWRNFTTDYKPLVDYAKSNGLPFIATNVPRRYASYVARGGFEALDTLSAEARNWMAPLPIAYDSSLPGYVNMLKMMPGHGGPNLPKAQALKDASMAYSILQHLEPGKLFIHYNGSYHSENREGICWYLLRGKPAMKLATITVVSQKDIHKLLAENRNKADYIICVVEDMTTTY